MKKLRISKDYVAVDVVDKEGNILETPIYLQINKPSSLSWLDRDENKWTHAFVTYNGKNLRCKGDMEWESDIDELLTEAKPYRQFYPGNSD